jgi:hypothetical protein
MANRYRSKLEERLARWLQTNEHEFEYEPSKVPYIIEANYIPDFVLPNGVILEAKGYFPPEDRRKMLAVIKANPDLDIRLVFQNPKTPISTRSKTSYGLWCDKNDIKWCHYLNIPHTWFE